MLLPTRRRRFRARLAMGLGAVLCLAACSQTVGGTGRGLASAHPGSSPGSPTPSVTFSTCDSVFPTAAVPVPPSLIGQVTFGCTVLPVPLNYRHPNGQKINLQLLRVHDTDDPHPIGSLLVNPGGPGGSGVQLALGLLGQLAPTILQHFDLIGFDPRGVGLSDPIVCVDGPTEDALTAASPDMSTPAGLAQVATGAAQFDDACNRKYGAALAQFNTVNAARDMDRIRAAVGDRQMNYLGFSYGTELGSVYAHLFPGKIRVAVLDGAVDPLTSGITQLANQLQGFEQAFDQFAANCATVSPCNSLGNARTAAIAVLDAAQAHPLTTSDGRQLTGSLASTGMLEALYSRTLWPTLTTALISAQHGDGTGLIGLSDRYYQRNSDGSYGNIFDAYTAITCNDTTATITAAQIAATARAWTAQFPLSGRWQAGLGDQLPFCEKWQPHRSALPKPTAPTTTKVLVIGNLHDPATPYQGAKDLAATMGNAQLLSWDGEGHTSYLEGSSCIDDYVNQYLIHQTLPPTGEVCPK